MHLASDYIHPTPHRGFCRIRIYLPGDERDAPVVVCSEVVGNEGQSVTNAVEQIAAEVIRYNELSVPVWIEHYPPETTDGRAETFDLVTFGHHEVREIMRGGGTRLEIGPPTWKRLDRASVEVLVGVRSDVWCGQKRTTNPPLLCTSRSLLLLIRVPLFEKPLFWRLPEKHT